MPLISKLPTALAVLAGPLTSVRANTRVRSRASKKLRARGCEVLPSCHTPLRLPPPACAIPKQYPQYTRATPQITHITPPKHPQNTQQQPNHPVRFPTKSTRLGKLCGHHATFVSPFDGASTRPSQNESRKPSTDMAFTLIYRVSLCAHMVPGGARYGGGSRACGTHCLHCYGAQEASEQGCARHPRSLHDDWSLTCAHVLFPSFPPLFSLDRAPFPNVKHNFWVLLPGFTLSCDGTKFQHFVQHFV